ncbi:MAG: DUF2189 domain-containing protein [Burkholderiaceae bacterium]|nr:DUF2189 domain-containing protein [Burkholderiaceae bacterium]
MPTSTATIGPARIAAWLARGARDLRRAPLASLAHGVVFAIVALAILAIGWGRGWLLAGAFTGFVLPAPALATGLYELSRRLERGQSATLSDAVSAWRAASPALLRFGALLAAIGTAWVGFCWLVVRASIGTGGDVAGVPAGGAAELLRLFADERGSALFVAWMVAGGLVAAIVFAIGVVSVPMLLERRVTLRDAVLASVRTVGEHPFTMALWAAAIMLATLVAAATVVGWVLVVPLLGHASWHAYRDLVGEDALPAGAAASAR